MLEVFVDLLLQRCWQLHISSPWLTLVEGCGVKFIKLGQLGGMRGIQGVLLQRPQANEIHGCSRSILWRILPQLLIHDALEVLLFEPPLFYMVQHSTEISVEEHFFMLWKIGHTRYTCRRCNHLLYIVKISGGPMVPWFFPLNILRGFPRKFWCYLCLSAQIYWWLALSTMSKVEILLWRLWYAYSIAGMRKVGVYFLNELSKIFMCFKQFHLLLLVIC